MVTQAASLNWTLMQNWKAHLNGTLLLTQATPLNQTLMASMLACLAFICMSFSSLGWVVLSIKQELKSKMSNYYWDCFKSILTIPV